MAIRSHDSVILSILALNVLSTKVYSCACFICVYSIVFLSLIVLCFNQMIRVGLLPFSSQSLSQSCKLFDFL